MPFRFQDLSLPGLVLIERKRFSDCRGYFEEQYKSSEFQAYGVPERFPQGNLSFSRGGILRGLHFQYPPKAQGKLVSVLVGEILDVAVDLRAGSPGFRRWEGVILSEANRLALYIPEGFAHGFLVLSETAYVTYRVTEEYSPALDAGIRWDDPDIGIEWPVPCPQLSDKDRLLPCFRELHEAPIFVYEEE